MGERSPIVALIMAFIPLVGFYLVYSWWGEMEKKWKLGENPLINTILFIIPIVNIYGLYKLVSTIDAGLKKAGQPGYPFSPIIMMISFCIPIVNFYTLLYVFFYQTQAQFNAAGV